MTVCRNGGWEMREHGPEEISICCCQTSRDILLGDTGGTWVVANNLVAPHGLVQSGSPYHGSRESRERGEFLVCPACPNHSPYRAEFVEERRRLYERYTQALSVARNLANAYRFAAEMAGTTDEVAPLELVRDAERLAHEVDRLWTLGGRP